jgi:hypothetical protein
MLFFLQNYTMEKYGVQNLDCKMYSKPIGIFLLINSSY